MTGKGSLKSRAPPGDHGKGEGMHKRGLTWWHTWEIQTRESEVQGQSQLHETLSQNEGERRGGRQECGEHRVTTRCLLFFTALGDSGVICLFYRLVSGHWGKCLHGPKVGSNGAKTTNSVTCVWLALWHGVTLKVT